MYREPRFPVCHIRSLSMVIRVRMLWLMIQGIPVACPQEQNWDGSASQTTGIITIGAKAVARLRASIRLQPVDSELPTDDESTGDDNQRSLQ